MPEHSRVAQEQIHVGAILKDIFMGDNKRKIVSATVLLIIGFLIHVRNKKEAFEGVGGDKPSKKGEQKKVGVRVGRAAEVTSTAFFGPASSD